MTACQLGLALCTLHLPLEQATSLSSSIDSHPPALSPMERVTYNPALAFSTDLNSLDDRSLKKWFNVLHQDATECPASRHQIVTKLSRKIDEINNQSFKDINILDGISEEHVQQLTMIQRWHWMVIFQTTDFKVPTLLKSIKSRGLLRTVPSPANNDTEQKQGQEQNGDDNSIPDLSGGTTIVLDINKGTMHESNANTGSGKRSVGTVKKMKQNKKRKQLPMSKRNGSKKKTASKQNVQSRAKVQTRAGSNRRISLQNTSKTNGSANDPKERKRSQSRLDTTSKKQTVSAASAISKSPIDVDNGTELVHKKGTNTHNKQKKNLFNSLIFADETISKLSFSQVRKMGPAEIAASVLNKYIVSQHHYAIVL